MGYSIPLEVTLWRELQPPGFAHSPWMNNDIHCWAYIYHVYYSVATFKGDASEGTRGKMPVYNGVGAGGWYALLRASRFSIPHHNRRYPDPIPGVLPRCSQSPPRPILPFLHQVRALYQHYCISLSWCACLPDMYTLNLSQCYTVFVQSRPLINGQLEEKVCGEGPCLEDVFEDDSHLEQLNNSIQVYILHTYIGSCVHLYCSIAGVCECGISESWWLSAKVWALQGLLQTERSSGRGEIQGRRSWFVLTLTTTTILAL